ncbi:MAG: response regulator transcription factor, partial [Microcoleaceae cyanobacterium]
MASVKILVVDDDQAIRNLVCRFLSQQNYQIESAKDGETALALFGQFQPDLVVLDINLPDTTGFHLCQEMQSQTDVFVLMLTSLTDEESIKKALQNADDYVKKPFGLVELNARIRAILRRQRICSEPKPQKLKFGDLVIDPIGREVTIKSKVVPLTALQFDLLYCMVSQPNYAWKRSELYQKVWDSEWLDPKVCDVHISQ